MIDQVIRFLEPSCSLTGTYNYRTAQNRANYWNSGLASNAHASGYLARGWVPCGSVGARPGPALRQAESPAANLDGKGDHSRRSTPSPVHGESMGRNVRKLPRISTHTRTAMPL